VLCDEHNRIKGVDATERPGPMMPRLL